MQINLPEGGSDYDRRLRVMLYQYLRMLDARLSAAESSGGSSAIVGSAVLTVPAGSSEHTESVSIAGVTSSMVAMFTLGEHSASDINHESLLNVVAMRATCTAGSVSFFLAFGEPVSGPVRINYMVS